MLKVIPKKPSKTNYKEDVIKKAIKLKNINGAVYDEDNYTVGYVKAGKYYTGGPKEVEGGDLRNSLLKRHEDEKTQKGPLKTKKGIVSRSI